MRVLHIGEYIKGGVATYIREVVDFQISRKEITDIYLMQSSSNSEVTYKLPDTHLITYNYKRKIPYFIKSLFKINKEIKKLNPDIIHVHSTFAGVFVRLPLLFYKRDFKVIYCPHGWAFCMETSEIKRKIYLAIEKLLAKRTDLIINISEYEQFESIKRGISRDKLLLINNGISNQREIRNIQLDLDKNKINILFVGRFDKQKGLDILLSFLKTYDNNALRFYIIGDNVLENIDIEIPSSVITLGWIDNSKIDSYYSLFDAVIIPSRWEGFGLVAIEAMKNKKAIIVSNRGALPDFVKVNNGYVFELENLETLEIILDSLNKEELVQKGNKGFELFNSCYTSIRMNEEILNCYEELLQE
ncbi:glycosyltransferase [Bacillus sp. AFS037270]|uniref:glycosyltransferase n=1 Tax=Bacillus sp. AFS037270 TaxID=2033499 RepID=UPI000BFD91E6|nr:glycosyltransferase [Bacillus sp. AFS037270]PGV53355.1 glycosyl transferase [Bacillus sp. AFS037270]